MSTNFKRFLATLLSLICCITTGTHIVTAKHSVVNTTTKTAKSASMISGLFNLIKNANKDKFCETAANENTIKVFFHKEAAIKEVSLEEYIKGVLYGEVPDEVIIEENGLKMSVDVKNGQKTGYFLDQKENRFALRRYAAGGRVLDCFCNSGGFSLNAAITAKQVTAVDVSQFALDNVNKNAQLNGLKNIKTECADVFALLREKRAAGEKYDLVVLDPPAFCKSASEAKDAYRGYKDINILGMKLVEKGGYLATCSCSHYMTLPMFEKMLSEAAKESGRRVRALEIRIQAPDHPALLNEEETMYLKFFVLQVL